MQKDGVDSRSVTAFHVRNTIAHHPRSRQVDTVLLSSLLQKIRRRFPARTGTGNVGCNAVRVVEAVVSLTKVNSGSTERLFQPAVNRSQVLQRALTFGVVWLVRHHKQQVSLTFQLLHCRQYAWDEVKLFGGLRRFHRPGLWIQDVVVEHTIPIQKYRGTVTYLIDSHFISFFFRFG